MNHSDPVKRSLKKVAHVCHTHKHSEARTPDSLLPPSEPPDLKNWFSSYEYESLVLESNDKFGFSNYEESQGYGKECSQLEENKCLNQVLDSPGSPLLSSEPPGIENWFCSYEYESPAPETLDHLILSHHKESMVDKDGHCNGKRKEVEKVDAMISSQRLEECDNGSPKDGKNSTGNHVQNKLPNHESVGTDTDSNPNSRKAEANGNSWERTGSSKHEEDEGVGNGFVSVRSIKRIKDDKSVNGKRFGTSVVGKMKGERERRRTPAIGGHDKHSSWKMEVSTKEQTGHWTSIKAASNWTLVSSPMNYE